METSNETLVRQALAGNAAAFGDLLSRNYDLIYRLAFRMLGSQSEAEDLTQDICACLPAKLESFNHNARFTTWLYRVTTNAAIDQIRKRQGRIRAGQGWGEWERMNRETRAERETELEWLKQAMNLLTPELRQTVSLVLGEDLTHGQAAQILGVSEGTISWRMSKVKKTLREMAKAEEQTNDR